MTKKLSKGKIQERVWHFIYEFRDKVVARNGEKIDFMIIYGSSVRREFVPGKSDVDIVIQIFDERDRGVIEEDAAKIFWKVACKYPELQFEKSLSVSRQKKRDAITHVLEKIEQSSFLYVPVFVFVKGEIDWQKGELHSDNPLIQLGQSLLVPQRTVFLRFKQEGEILYGRDIRKEIAVRLTLIDRLRVGVVPLFLSAIGFLLSPIVSGKGRGYAVKALLYQTDSLLTTLDEYERMEHSKKIARNQKMLLEEFTEYLQKFVFLRLDYTKGFLRPVDFRLLTDAMRVKWGKKRFGYFGTIWFCFKAWFFIIRSNLRALALVLLRWPVR